MPLPNLPVPKFPNVPALPGVPPLLRNLATTALAPITVLTGDALGLGGPFTGPDWGIFDDSGNAVIEADSCVAVEIMGEYRVADYPIEQGGFESYNKVTVPYDARVQLCRGGAETDRIAFLNQIRTAAKALDLYTVTTPEQTYVNANIVHFDFRRTARQGATLITADVWLREIRVATAAAFSSPATPSAALIHDDGNVAPVTPPVDTALPAGPT